MMAVAVMRSRVEVGGVMWVMSITITMSISITRMISTVSIIISGITMHIMTVNITYSMVGMMTITIIYNKTITIHNYHEYTENIIRRDMMRAVSDKLV